MGGHLLCCNNDHQQASFNLVVKKAAEKLLTLRVSLWRLLASATFKMASRMADSASSVLGELLVEECRVGVYSRLGYCASKIGDVWQEGKRGDD